MTISTGSLLVWAPRILGVGIAVFLALFALDAFERGFSGASLRDFAIHLLPALLVLAAVALAWRWPWIGGVIFVLLAAIYAVSVPGRFDWILVIAGPLLLTGLLFIWSWRHQAV
jgi:glucose-6-phosphate-specific signal transduction histidine kinase